MKNRCICPVTTVSTGGSSDIEAFDIEETSRGVKLRIGTTPFALPLHGTQNAGNILLAVAVAEHLGVQRNVISNRLARFHPLTGTFSVEDHSGVTVLNDTHNCSPESASAAIRWAQSQPATQKILLTSGIIEQGQETMRVHKDLGSQSAQVFDRVIFTNKKFAQIFEQGYGKKVEVYSQDISPIPAGSLLVALGRVPKLAMEKLLPHAQ
jgi:UDP-N-acetylmuramyl pentapeptide synthase